MGRVCSQVKQLQFRCRNIPSEPATTAVYTVESAGRRSIWTIPSHASIQCKIEPSQLSLQTPHSTVVRRQSAGSLLGLSARLRFSILPPFTCAGTSVNHESSAEVYFFEKRFKCRTCRPVNGDPWFHSLVDSEFMFISRESDHCRKENCQQY